VSSDTNEKHTPVQLFLDLSRLVYAACSRTPTGIPRVELAYAEYLIANYPERLKFVVLDAIGRQGLADRRQAALFVSEISRYWRKHTASKQAYAKVVRRALWIHLALLLQRPGRLAHSIDRHPGRSIYVIVSQLAMERTRRIERLKRSGKLRLVYFVHDIFPSLFPEYFPADAEGRNRKRMAGAARLADVVIANSQDTANLFTEHFAKDRRPDAIVVAPLGVGIVRYGAGPVVPADRPYFVMVGTIEPRKNHLLILTLWRSLRAELGAKTPRLILIGGRGWENENIVDMLERSPPLRGLVEERGRVSDDEMARLLAGSIALLMPSFAEGYGLPLAEALSLGVPAICSDLPAFREVGKDVPEFIDPVDGLGWRSAILDYAAPESPRRGAQLARLARWQAPNWSDHFEHISKWLD
jgi:glycosyltransferase involved in cell wall biosynthesis